MATLDDDIDRLYQGPLDTFTGARNALAKAAKRPELKTLEKPSLPAWTVNQLHWHHRAVIDRLQAAAAALLEQHHRLLAGAPAGVQKAEQAHRDAVKDAFAAAREVLRAGGHADTAATLDAVRNTLQALPAPEAQGRLTRPLAPRGLEALAGLVLPARAPSPANTAAADAPRASARQRDADRFGAKARADQARAKQREEAQRQAEAEQAERERARQEQRAAARAALAAADAALKDAEAAVSDAERALAARQAERYAAQQAVKRARQTAAD